MPPRPPPANPSLVAAALSAAVGPALVLDDKLRVVLVTPDVRALLGADVPLGVSAPKVLCGKSPTRIVAQALAEGRPVQALIPHPAGNGHQRMLKVRSLPLGEAGRPAGWLLLIDEVSGLGGEPLLFHGMWTQTQRMREVFRIIERVAPEEVTVLVRGETGTGKELVAQAIHDLSPRAKGPLRAINCAAVPANLIESELFGHVRGAFTGAVRDAPGHFQLASRGTLFLDEVAELPLDLQAKLLRVLETRSVLPVGGRQPVSVDVRIVSATHRALRKEVETGRFRADLMYRLRVIPIFLPALRERREDIALICHKSILNMNKTARRRIESVSPAALAALERYDWPGNVRELQNVLAYAYTIGDGSVLQAADLPAELLDVGNDEAASRPLLHAARERMTRDHPPGRVYGEQQRLLEVLERTGGNKNKAAKILGISRVTLWRRLREQRSRDDTTPPDGGLA